MQTITRQRTVRAAVAAVPAVLALAAPAARADVIHAGGSINTPTTWSAAEGDHIVTGTIQIAHVGSLTIEEGCTVRFEADVRLEVSGTLTAVGGATGILFTERDPGDAWRGILFYHNGTGTISDCTIEHASSSGATGIEVQQSAAVTIQDCTIRENYRGIRVWQGTAPPIGGCTIEDNVVGVRFEGVPSLALTQANTLADNATGVKLLTCTNVTIDNQTITGSMGAEGAISFQQCGEFTLGSGNAVTGNSWGLTIDVGSAPSLASAGNIPLAGNVNDDGIQIRSGGAAGNVIWRDLGADYVVTGFPLVNGNSAFLTIEQGCTVRFDAGTYLEVTGTLITASGPNGALFTRRHPGESWGGIRFFTGDGTLQDCTIEYAAELNRAGVRLESSTATIQGCVFRDNDRGIHAVQSTPLISGCTFEDNATGIRYDNATSPSLTAANTFVGNTTGVRFQSCTSVTIDNQTITESPGVDGAIHVASSGEFTLGPGNAVTGNSWGLTIDLASGPSLASAGNIPITGNANDIGIQVRGGYVTSSIWHDLGVDYIVTAGTPTVANSGHMTIDDGVIVLFAPGQKMSVVGSITAVAEETAIQFRALDPQAGWDGFEFWTGDGTFTNCVFREAAGTGNRRAFLLQGGSSLALEDCTLTHNDYGVNAGGATASFKRCTITENNTYGIYLGGTATTASFGSSLSEWNDIHDNGGGIVGRDLHCGVEDIAAPFVYWGTLDEAEIELAILHEPDNGQLGRVTYSPWTNEDHTAALGVTFADVTPPGLLDQITAVGASWGDYDGDGDPDLFVAAHGPNKLLRNDDGTLVDVTPAEFDDAYQTLKAAWGDLENDGDLDLLVTNFDGPTRLYRNEGTGWVEAGLPPNQSHWDAAWGDVEPDGDLDLVLVPSTGDAAELWLNDGAGSLAYDSSLDGPSFAHAAAWGDFDDDGLTDLAVSGSLDGAPEVTFLRNQTGGLIPLTSYTNIGNTHYGTIAWADADGDGNLDCHAAGYDFADILVCSDGQAPVPCTPPILADPGIASSGSWTDVDNDGWTDLYLSKGDGANRLLQNLGAHEFLDVASTELASETANYGAAWADVDGDGDMDLFVAGENGASKLLRNDAPPSNHWLQVDLEGIATNRFGYGARITVQAGGTEYVHEVSTGSGRLAQSSVTAEFGLGQATQVDAVIVRWTTGTEDVYGPFAADQRITLTEQIMLLRDGLEIGFPDLTQGMAWGDYDDDGDEDLYVTRNGVDANQLYRNDAGTLIEVPGPLDGLPGVSSNGASWGDYDDDGLLDLIIVGDGVEALLHNDGTAGFTDVTPASMLFDNYTSMPYWVDVDNDGDLDVYLAAFGSHHRLFRNDGGGDFVDITSGVLTEAWSYLNASWGDFDDDGDMDLAAGHVTGLRLLRNDAAVFADVTDRLPWTVDPGSDATWVDVDEDGDLDLFAAGLGHDNILARNDGDEVFVDITPPDLVDGVSRASWIDYDNDGDLDVYARWQTRLLRNDGSGFVDRSSEIWPDLDTNGSATWVDIDEDGSLDMMTSIYGRTFRNTGIHGNHALRVHLEGTVSNRTGIGARVRAVAGPLRQHRFVSVTGLGGQQNSMVLHFGLGQEAMLDSLVIDWPSGIWQVLTDIPAGSEITVVEEQTVGAVTPTLAPAFAIEPAVPNPFRSATRLAFGLPEPSRVSLRIFDVRGRLVRVLEDETRPAGRHSVLWDGRDAGGRQVAAGIYFYRLDAGPLRERRRVVRVR